DGTTISIGDGTNEVLFEFEDSVLNNGISPNHVAVPYTNRQSGATVANTLASVINSLVVQREIQVRADSPFGSNRIDLFGNAVVNPNTGARTGIITEPSDTIATAIASDVGVDGGQRFTAIGTIGDNTEIGAGLDVDIIGFTLNAGDRVSIDVDSLDAPVDTMLNLYDATGRLLAASDDDAGPGEQMTLEPFISFTATAAGEYFVGVSGFSNRDYDPNVIGSGIAVQNLGDYQIEIVVGGTEEILEVLVNEHRGDTNPFRDQGQIIIDSARITNSAGFGISIDEGPRDAADQAPHPGTPRVLFNRNEERLYTGVTVKNNVVAFNRDGAIRYSGTPTAQGVPAAAVPFGRIVNNTLVGGKSQVVGGVRDTSPLGTGILVEENSSPTILNNIITNFEVGINVDATSRSTVIGATLYKDNLANSTNGLGQTAILLQSNDPLFVNGETGNFYLAVDSKAIDSSINSVADRSNYSNLTSKLGSPVSPILAPDYDITGLLRVDDPRVDTPAGQGENVFKDRGAIDRADFIGPQAVLLKPQDNDTDGKDQNPGANIVQVNNPVLTSFQIQLQDGITEQVQTQRGSGIDELTVVSDAVKLLRNGRLLTEGIDYLFSYDVSNRVIQLTPLAGIWQPGRVYEIEINNSEDGGIRDNASNLLQPNNQLGTTRFTISIGGEAQDFGDAPAEYPTTLLNNGASHVIQSSVFLGASVDRESDGQPSADASADTDDGVTFVSPLVPGRTSEIQVTASKAGKLNAWIDFNMDGDWNDGGEQVLTNADTVGGVNTYNISVPLGTTFETTFARFRFNTEGGLSPTGLALDGEVEDYQVDIVSATPWQNQSEPMDVTADGHIVPMDVLRIINQLNNRTIVSETGKLPNPPAAPNTPDLIGYLDVDGDGFVSPRDALLVINYLNSQRDQAEGERDPMAAQAVFVGEPVNAPDVIAALNFSDSQRSVSVRDVLQIHNAQFDSRATELSDSAIESLFDDEASNYDVQNIEEDWLSDAYQERNTSM
ncbi:MAG: DVUA0089 family protein, partial [Planctomycetales bacterium]|nr:DVUA0089 family protein [Planctomycetales bacterium]